MEFEFIPDVIGGKDPEQLEDYLNSVAVDVSLVDAIEEWVASLPDQVEEINESADPQKINDGYFAIISKAQIILKAMCEAFNMLVEDAALVAVGGEDC